MPGLCTVRTKPMAGVLAALLLVACPRAPAERPHHRVGYMVCNSRDETLHRFGPLTAHLAKTLDIDLEPVAIDTQDFTRELGTLDFTHTNSLLYVIMARHHGVEVLAAERAGELGAHTRGGIVSLKSRHFTSLEDLRGKTMAFGPPLGPTSYLVQLDLLLAAHLDPDNDLASYAIPAGSWKHEKVIYSVLFGRHDAAAVPMLDFQRMAAEGRIDPADFDVLALSEPVLYCNFAVTQRTDPALAARFQAALLALKPEDTVALGNEVIRVLERARADGYERVRDQDFDNLRDMARRTNMPPFQRY